MALTIQMGEKCEKDYKDDQMDSFGTDSCNYRYGYCMVLYKFGKDQDVY